VRYLALAWLMDQVVYPKYTMHGYSYDPEDPQNTWSVATLKSGFQSNLPWMRPALQKISTKVFDEEVLKGKKEDNTNGIGNNTRAMWRSFFVHFSNNSLSPGWINIGPSSVAHKVACNLNTRVILGEELCTLTPLPSLGFPIYLTFT
jgi:hypothetical protein